MIRSFSHADFPLPELLERKRRTVSVVLPAREVADTVGPIVDAVLSLGELVDQVLVVDAGSRDGTAAVARAAGAEVRDEAELWPGPVGVGKAAGDAPHEPVLGKGDAMWRALAAVRGELVAYVDSDTRDFSPHFVTGLLGPLLREPDVEFVKAGYRRPFTLADGAEIADGGGRVSQLTARPLLAAFYPPLAEMTQPLAGEVAASRALFERIPFATGYAVEMAMLIDVLGLVGAEGIAQVDVGERRNYHQPLPQLRPMAEQTLATVCERLRRDGRLRDGGPTDTVVERPPLGEPEGRSPT